MEQIVCEYCGTSYDSSLDQCPLCGRQNEPQEESKPTRGRKAGGARLAQPEDKIPKWLQILICIILGLVVLIGAVFAFSQLEVFSQEETLQDDPNLTLPIEDQDNREDSEENNPSRNPDENDNTLDNSVQTSEDVTPDDQLQNPDEETEPVIACTRLALDRTDVSFFEAGESFQLNADVSPSDCTEPVTYESKNDSLCTVDETGLVTAVNGGGSTEIVVTCGEKSQTCTIRCQFAYDASLGGQNDANGPSGSDVTYSLSSTDITLFKGGETATLRVTNAPAGAAISWATSDASIVTVDGNGTVTAVSAGTANVTATIEGQTLTCIVRCRITGTAIATENNAESTGNAALSQTDVTLFSVGESFTLSAEGGTVQSWSVADSSVCTVDSNGTVTATGAGTTTVSAMVGGQTLNCIVRVNLS